MVTVFIHPILILPYIKISLRHYKIGIGTCHTRRFARFKGKCGIFKKIPLHVPVHMYLAIKFTSCSLNCNLVAHVLKGS
jgi:hypothetical protein